MLDGFLLTIVVTPCFFFLIVVSDFYGVEFLYRL